MATLAPEGTEWHGLLVELGQQWKEVTNGEVRLRIYPGGVVGDERDMIRKMRIGQIHGAAISNEGMTEINPYFTTFYMPMMYQSYDEVDFVRERLSDELLNITEDNGFKILTMVDVGWAYWFSTEPIYTPDDLKNNKIFIWAGDYKSVQLYEKHGYQPVPLAMTDVLSGLQTGLITSLGFNPLYALAQQLFGIADNMLEMKWGNLTAAIIIDLKTWNKIKPEYQQSMLTVAKKIGNGFQEKNRYESDKSVEVMKKYGLKVNKPSPEQVQIWNELINSMSADIRGSLIEENAYDRLMEIKKEMESR
ncbi:MAG: TRAP transporter substrate-binding protein DctP [Candidatus Marinimicrobia bacterium]|nr:TRAP transporter substrate-binding protein DctP [Candidatus Neomarinimicrobiota bacterium]MBT4150070.1 TRAP transporter substrate-binding protein DctP [Candidatus Neomarinimicrobiota bacterium]MBT4318301.1 TRAP transporter substrate-binding protein DctP [Candidatus Neomarinimicrobiota bacterium]MBT4784508.1 TRAP transporter substrate-binding protein DctP [Candidatus Neomarinimicrobiota bacterium]MBT5097433.1 TRAP transporter substrate-binding protein DctP [Candidatus Neomarinimicrobiota bact